MIDLRRERLHFSFFSLFFFLSISPCFMMCLISSHALLRQPYDNEPENRMQERRLFQRGLVQDARRAIRRPQRRRRREVSFVRSHWSRLAFKHTLETLEQFGASVSLLQTSSGLPSRKSNTGLPAYVPLDTCVHFLGDERCTYKKPPHDSVCAIRKPAASPQAHLS